MVGLFKASVYTVCILFHHDLLYEVYQLLAKNSSVSAQTFWRMIRLIGNSVRSL